MAAALCLNVSHGIPRGVLLEAKKRIMSFLFYFSQTMIVVRSFMSEVDYAVE